MDSEQDHLTLRCAVCGEPITRDTAFGPLRYFIHSDDTIRLSGGRLISTTDYAHAALPRCVETRISDRYL